MELNKVIESLSRWVVGSKKFLGQDATTLRPCDTKTHWFLLFATGFGVGYFPIAPGTLGTLITIPIYYFLSAIPSPIYELTLITFFFLSSWISEQAQNYWGRQDDSRIVIDEMMGFLITMLWLPKTIFSVITGFFLFRFFDILKPFPIRRMEKRWRGGYGVMLDDVLAGIYANIILQLVYLIHGEVWP